MCRPPKMTAKKLVKAPRCVVCSHPERARIEFGKVSGASLDNLALTFKVSRDSIHRHCLNHLSDDDRSNYLASVPLKELADKAAAEGTSVLDNLSIVRSTLMRSFQVAASVGDRSGTATLAGKLTDVLRTIGNLTGELGSMAVKNLMINNSTTILNSPVFASLQANLLHALAPFPEARAAVVAALLTMDESQPMKIIEQIPSTQSSATGTAPNVTTIDN
jgi:hypothetical protein